MFKILELANLPKEYKNTIDVFICFCSFEDRSLAIAQRIPIENINQAIIFYNEKHPDETEWNLRQFAQIIGSKGKFVPVKLFEPIELADAIVAQLKEIDCVSPKILVDITSFTHEGLLLFIAIVNKLFKEAIVEYAYCNAFAYASESKNPSERWLSRGLLEVRSVLGYAGEIDPTQDTVLIVMVGYECERAWRIIDAISPEELIITYNDKNSSTSPDNKEASETHANLLKDLAAYYQSPKEYIIPSDNPFDTAKKLDVVVASIDEDKNIIIIPMNNKISTVGAALVALQRPKVQLCYAPAIVYNYATYSVEGDKCYLFSLENYKY